VRQRAQEECAVWLSNRSGLQRQARSVRGKRWFALSSMERERTVASSRAEEVLRKKEKVGRELALALHLTKKENRVDLSFMPGHSMLSGTLRRGGKGLKRTSITGPEWSQNHGRIVRPWERQPQHIKGPERPDAPGDRGDNRSSRSQGRIFSKKTASRFSGRAPCRRPQIQQARPSTREAPFHVLRSLVGEKTPPWSVPGKKIVPVGSKSFTDPGLNLPLPRNKRTKDGEDPVKEAALRIMEGIIFKQKRGST